ncbi:MAG: hypothetical protein AAGG68_27680, partial [Bacteroidota bacterium]
MKKLDLYTDSDALEDIQAMILKPHAKDLVRCIFLEFKEGSEPFEKLACLAECITSAAEQNRRIDKFKSANADQKDIIIGAYLSYDGYLKLGLDLPNSSTFKNRMKWNSSSRLNDVSKEYWQTEFNSNIDMMLLLATNSKDQLNEVTKEIKKLFNHLIEQSKCFEENGERIYILNNSKKMSIEPFGYRDGLSQPRFFDKRKSRRNVILKDRWKQVIDGRGGSYLVFRKLEQDVIKFNCMVMELSKKLGISKEYAEAQIMGRFKNGVPLSEFATYKNLAEDRQQTIQDQFDDFYLIGKNQLSYENDPMGLKCPLHAHVRKVNPRNKDLNIQYNQQQSKPPRRARIVRRSIPYDGHDGTVGILFMSFQRDLDQFLQIQKDWSNDDGFSPGDKRIKPGMDPVIGQKDNTSMGSGKLNVQQWNTKWEEYGKISFDFTEVVSFRGGEYFYAPCISFFKNLRQRPK